jgi:hypothetical protein
VKFCFAAAILLSSAACAQRLVRQEIGWNPGTSVTHYQYGLMLFDEDNLQAAAILFQAALDGDLKPPDIKWWARRI